MEKDKPKGSLTTLVAFLLAVSLFVLNVVYSYEFHTMNKEVERLERDAQRLSHAYVELSQENRDLTAQLCEMGRKDHCGKNNGPVNPSGSSGGPDLPNPPMEDSMVIPPGPPLDP